MQISIQTLNWPEQWPERPLTEVEITYNKQQLVLHYTVQGEYIRAVAIEDQQPVWEDSCVEFFCQVPGEDTYMNFETNCIGTMVASRRRSRSEDVVPFSSEQMKKIERWSSLGERREIINMDDQRRDWEVEIRIPWSLIIGEKAPVFPLELKANFYKCGDKTKLPHFVSWQPIKTSSPDFHRPEFFGSIMLT